MSTTTSKTMVFKDFPFLTPDEFSEVCHHFDSQYCRATLGPLRQRWKLRLCTALDTTFASGVEYTTYLQIIRPLETTLDCGDLSSILDKFSFMNGSSERDALGLDDEAMIDAEESDEVMPSTLSHCGRLPDLVTRLGCSCQTPRARLGTRCL